MDSIFPYYISKVHFQGYRYDQCIVNLSITSQQTFNYIHLVTYLVSLYFSRAAVVRGQVITSSGMGLIGVRVSTTLPNEGFTMTREDGWFDLMVNGGGPVMLQFGRNPYPPLR